MTKRASKAQTKTATKRLPPGASPISGTPPPVASQFKEGNKAAVGHGRPRKLAEFQELIREVMAEELTIDGRAIITRAQAMVRLGLNKNPVPFLEYVFGKVRQETKERTYEDDIVDLLVSGEITEAQVYDELPDIAQRLVATARLRRNEGGEVEAGIQAD